MDASLGHPARWLDVAAAVTEAEDDHLVRVSWRVEVMLVAGDEPQLQLWCTVAPSVWSPHGGKEPIVRQRSFTIGRERPISAEMYRLLWSCMQTVPIIWPIGRVKKGASQDLGTT